MIIEDRSHLQRGLHMSIIEDIKGLVGEFRSGLAELAQQDQARIAEAQELRRTVARQAATLDEQREIILKLRAELEQERTEGSIDITELRAEIERRYEAQPDEMAQLLDQLYTAIERATPARPEIAEIGKERMRRHAVEQHVRTLLGILDATGGYMPSDYQAAIREAREAVTPAG